jgi:hypothetical protein
MPEVTTIVATLQILGVLTTLLAIWLFWCDHTNEFLLVLFPVALLLLGIGLAME